MASTEEMRQYLLARYPDSGTWAGRVKVMSDAQVFAIYTKFRKQEEKRKKSGKP